MITVFAHGLVQRSSLPIPEWLFGWAAAIVLCISFVALAALWPKPRLENPGWRPLPGGRALGSRAVEIVGGAIGVAILALVLVTGYAGPPTPLDNFAPTFVFIIFWVGLVFASVLFGDLFRLFNPWRAIGRVLFRGREPRAYPERLGRWPAAIGLLVFTWIELASGWGEHPATLAAAVTGYSVLTLAAMGVYGVEPWARHGEAFSVYFNLFSRMSVFETRDRVVGVRPFLGGLPRLDPVAGTVAMVVVMIGTVTFDGLSQGPALERPRRAAQRRAGHARGRARDDAEDRRHDRAADRRLDRGRASTRSGSRARARSAATTTPRSCARKFIHTLVPIAMVYVAAHYLTFLLFEGQSIFYLASDPLGKGWDLFGTASSAIDYGLLSQNAAWYVQVGFVVLGHIAALVLAHDRALVLYADPKLAVRSQYWMLAIMVGFTSLALWLLAQAGK